jgi:hypothetical protein
MQMAERAWEQVALSDADSTFQYERAVAAGLTDLTLDTLPQSPFLG